MTAAPLPCCPLGSLGSLGVGRVLGAEIDARPGAIAAGLIRAWLTAPGHPSLKGTRMQPLSRSVGPAGDAGRSVTDVRAWGETEGCAGCC